MPTIDTIAMNLLGAVAYAAGAYLAVEYILPRVRIIAAEVLRYPKTAEALTYLLSILVYIAAAQGVISRIVAIGFAPLNYVNILNPALDVLSGLVPWVKMVLLGIGIVLLAERIRLRA